MTKREVVLLAVAVVLIVLFIGRGLFAQSSLTIKPGGLLSQCDLPAAGALTFCNVANDPANLAGAYVSANGAPYFRVAATVTGGVTSFNGRSGAVVPASADYSYSQLSGPPTKISCSSASIATGATGTFVGTGCTIN